MTDRQGALGILANSEAPERETALAAFYERYKGDALVIDKWFTAQALSSRDDTLRAVAAAARAIPISAWSTRTGCARWSARSGPTSARSTTRSGEGYRFLADIRSSRSTSSIRRTRRSWSRRSAAGAASARTARELMRAELERILATPGLSKDVFEQVSKSLA